MATLVLTTVGGMIGGPIGAMLGGMIGQAVDREILFKPKGREGPRIDELKVQTSSYGTPIPRLFGTLRVAGSVIWATDLNEHRHREGGGKGRPSTTSYSYTASFAVALSARPILSVGRIWADGQLLRGAAGDWKVRTGFRLYPGHEDQEADPLIASAEGMDMAPAHRGIAYAVFEDMELVEFGNRIPALTFEVSADAGPVTLDTIARDLSGSAVTGGDQALGGFSAYGGSRRAVIEPLAEAVAAWPVQAEGAMHLTSGMGETAEIADIGSARGGSCAIAAADRAPRRVTLRHYDPARDYQAGLQSADRPGAGHREQTIDLPAAISADEAKRLAMLALGMADTMRERRDVTTSWSAIALSPGARVTIAGEPGQWRVAASRLEAMRPTLELVRIAPAAVPVTASSGRVLGAVDRDAGATILHAFEIPHPGDGLLAAPRALIAAAGSAGGWRRAALAVSTDNGVRWEAAGPTAVPAMIGTIVTPPGWANPAIEDRRNAMTVQLAHDEMALADANRAALDAGLNLALAGDELLQFGAAEPLGDGRWRLTRLWRGRRGTEAAVGLAEAGSRFILLEPGALAAWEPGAGFRGPARVMASAVNEPDGVEAELVVSGASVVPPSPVNAALTVLPAGDVELVWMRRSRAGWRWIDGIDAPLGEEAERYQLRFVASGTPARIESSGEARFTVPAAWRSATAIQVEIRQAGDHGLSLPALLTIPPIEE